MATTSTNSLELEKQRQLTFYSASPLYIRRISANEIIKITKLRVTGDEDEKGNSTKDPTYESPDPLSLSFTISIYVYVPLFLSV